MVVQSDYSVSSISISQRSRQIKRLRDRESLTTENNNEEEMSTDSNPKLIQRNLKASDKDNGKDQDIF